MYVMRGHVWRHTASGVPRERRHMYRAEGRCSCRWAEMLDLVLVARLQRASMPMDRVPALRAGACPAAP